MLRCGIPVCISSFLRFPRSICMSTNANHDARFAVSTSHQACPRAAAVECATSITKQMGGLPPTLVLLFANASSYGIEIGQLAVWTREVLHVDNGAKPTLLGCVLKGVSGDRAGSSPGMSLWAAHLPGVEVFPFRTGRTDSLPELPPGSWKKLLDPPSVSTRLNPRDGESTSSEQPKNAMILFSPPHFIEIEQLMLRMAALLPNGLKTMGCVGSMGAWGQHKDDDGPLGGHGAVFLNDEVVARDSAVGCILHGHFKVHTALVPGFRPVGPVMTVTESLRNLILEIDGLTAHEQIRRAVMDVQRIHGVHREDVKLGLESSGRPSDSTAESPSAPSRFASSSSSSNPSAATTYSTAGFDSSGYAGTDMGTDRDHAMVLRNWAVVDGSSGRSALMVASSRDIPLGSKMQLHCMRDPESISKSTLDAAGWIAGHEGAAGASAPPNCGDKDGTFSPCVKGSSGALLFSCSGLPSFEPESILSSLPSGCVLSGGCVEGELWGDGQAPSLHTFSRVLCVFK